MSSLTEIIFKLSDIQKDIEKIDLTKETDVKKIGDMANKPIKGIDEVIKRDDFNENHLKATVEMFKNANDKASAYDKQKDIDELTKNASDLTKVKEINERMKARDAAKKSIQGKYDELSKKQAVIEKYMEKYDPQYLVKKQNDKVDANKKKIEQNNTRISEIADFKNKVSGELGIIKNNLDLIDELNKMQDKLKEIETRENNLISIKATLDPDGLKAMEDNIKKDKNDINKKAGELAKKHKGIALDTSDLKTSISTNIKNAETNITNQKNSIKTKIKGSEKKYNYTNGFENLINEKVTDAGTDNKKFVEIFDNARKDLEKENMNLDFENGKISENVETLELGEKVRKDGKPVSTILGPTDEEIQEVIENDPEFKALVPVLTNKEKSQVIYNSLIEGKKSKSPFLHPIAFLKSRFDKEAKENWVLYDKDLKQKAIDKIKAEGIKKSNAAKMANDKRKAFSKSLMDMVKTASADEVKKMDENAEKAPGDLLVDVYDKMDDGSR